MGWPRLPSPSLPAATMTDLHAQLRAAVEERKRVAEAAMATVPQTYGTQALATPQRILADYKRDTSVLDRHNRDTWPFEGYCFWCSEETVGSPILIEYPCPEIRDLAEEYGVTVS